MSRGLNVFSSISEQADRLEGGRLGFGEDGNNRVIVTHLQKKLTRPQKAEPQARGDCACVRTPASRTTAFP